MPQSRSVRTRIPWAAVEWRAGKQPIHRGWKVHCAPPRHKGLEKKESFDKRFFYGNNDGRDAVGTLRNPSLLIAWRLMNILNDLFGLLDWDAPVRDIRQGVFHTGVLTRSCGLAATLPRDALKQEPPLVRDPGTLLERTPRELAGMAFSERILEAAIGMATLNSLLDINEAACIEVNAAELILREGENRRVAIVGHFPFIPRVREKVRELWVIEKNQREGDFAETDAEHLLPKADVVAITGTALTNHTLEDLLALCSKAYVILLGDTVPITPLLFDYGVDAVCGSKVIDPDLALKCVSQGANFRQIKGLRRLSMLKP